MTAVRCGVLEQLFGLRVGSARCHATRIPSAGPVSLAPGSPIRVSGPGGEGRFAVGYHVETLVDASQSTPANAAIPAQTSRTLQTFIFYPATGAPPHKGVGGASVRRNASPEHHGGPFPLIVFAHGFGTDPNLTEHGALLEQWAAAGFVVAAPLFPLTRGDAPGGPDLADFANQPGDMAFVARQMVAQAKASGDLLSGLVDTHEIGAAGHSLGGVTTLGLMANSCCKDPQIKAAVVMSGDPITFPTGAVDYTSAPPLLLAHGNADQAVPCVSSIDALNAASGPKGLLTVVKGDHDSPGHPDGEGAPQCGAHDHRLLRSLPQGRDGRGRSPGGPGVAINILQCSVPQPTTASDYNLKTATLLHADPQGSGSLPFVVHPGLAGTGLCDATHPQCVVVINQGGSLSLAATVATPISFAP
jgi:dienelactone hydrolase